MSGDKSFATVPGFVGDKLYSFRSSGAGKEQVPGDGATEEPGDRGKPRPDDPGREVVGPDTRTDPDDAPFDIGETA
jgi:hypothetical protein